MHDEEALLILAHGSRAAGTEEVIYRIADRIKNMSSFRSVVVAFLQFNHPDIHEAIKKIVDDGIKRIITVPFFLFEGNHVQEDIPREFEKAMKQYHVDIRMTKPIGYDDRLVEILMDRISEAIK
ncbi:sirohydrochlorin cobaltochelatase [Caldanaerobius fijiensis DSM 17918]|uniref:Sirohydrochlorin cobaltochelatase n=1 Tax=Caldanaerobius fijiensis DSM 17918 TaxID=1121256 RepID=A0A1M4YNV4_9THEO|nr:CbiX/SirB N-terminal domain-containing protein [Caldanaerobius fijiensis]SHF07333.1 sirohydrochlorin cobaltochelatase [Caldanaerobius fijiensis DSM 17918]